MTLTGIVVLTLDPDAEAVSRIHWFINIDHKLAPFGLAADLAPTKTP